MVLIKLACIRDGGRIKRRARKSDARLRLWEKKPKETRILVCGEGDVSDESRPRFPYLGTKYYKLQARKSRKSLLSLPYRECGLTCREISSINFQDILQDSTVYIITWRKYAHICIYFWRLTQSYSLIKMSNIISLYRRYKNLLNDQCHYYFGWYFSKILFRY